MFGVYISGSFPAEIDSSMMLFIYAFVSHSGSLTFSTWFAVCHQENVD